jgi:hypothetical protein
MDRVSGSTQIMERHAVIMELTGGLLVPYLNQVVKAQETLTITPLLAATTGQ